MPHYSCDQLSGGNTGNSESNTPYTESSYMLFLAQDNVRNYCQIQDLVTALEDGSLIRSVNLKEFFRGCIRPVCEDEFVRSDGLVEGIYVVFGSIIFRCYSYTYCI